MKTVLGILLLLLGVVVLVWGRRKLKIREGPVLRFFTQRSKIALQVTQLALAFAAFYLGIGLILGWYD